MSSLHAQAKGTYPKYAQNSRETDSFSNLNVQRMRVSRRIAVVHQNDCFIGSREIKRCRQDVPQTQAT